MVSAADDIRHRHKTVIARAEARAAADVQLGIDNLRASIDSSPEFHHDGRQLVPVRALLLSALRRTEAARSHR